MMHPAQRCPPGSVNSRRGRVEVAGQQFVQTLDPHAEAAGLRVAAAAHGFCQWDGVEGFDCAQADFDDVVFGHRPQQRKAAALLGQDVAHFAGEGAGAIDHHACLSIEHNGGRTAGDVLSQRQELLVHGLATLTEVSHLRVGEVGNL